MKKTIIIIILIIISGVIIILNNTNKNATPKTIDHIEKKQTEETNETYTYENQEGEEIEIQAEKSVSATGFAGASNHVFYLKNNKLYYKNLSNNTEELIAENVKDLYLDGEDVTASLNSNGKIIKENNYITYKKS